MLGNTELLAVPLEQLMSPGCLVVVWVTNRQKHRDFVTRQLFPRKHNHTPRYMVLAEGNFVTEYIITIAVFRPEIYDPRHAKMGLMPMLPVKLQTSLYIHAVWPEATLFGIISWKVCDLINGQGRSLQECVIHIRPFFV
ncbi:hypothetical protein DPMN_082042 [Dreissena polymorpha]|uniref:Uncharacterized protein n=1 Tax=Dreissena polymorpha TaxID=45954 RepID=A0A9D3Y7E9_DREPO|nr:hypothetical protein DPMN_082042 [Dreissena polymorpha]